MRILLADPPSFTPPYDHELAAALARAGADVELVTSPFRFGAAPTPDGYRRSELFYPLSSRLFRRSRLRLPLKLLEHPLGMARLARRAGDVVHLQWLSVPQLDRVLLRHRAISGCGFSAASSAWSSTASGGARRSPSSASSRSGCA